MVYLDEEERNPRTRLGQPRRRRTRTRQRKVVNQQNGLHDDGQPGRLCSPLLPAIHLKSTEYFSYVLLANTQPTAIG
eukprot:scaffold27754_cov61-Amphora_coffeaeformis.AAC.1